jgi:hypothetical protein
VDVTAWKSWADCSAKEKQLIEEQHPDLDHEKHVYLITGDYVEYADPGFDEDELQS